MAQSANTQSAREASLARRRAMSTTGKAALGHSAAPTRATRTATATSATSASRPAPRAASSSPRKFNSSREASRARRDAMSTTGKAGIKVKDRTRKEAGMVPEATSTMASATPAAKKEKSREGCSCGGKKQAQTVRTENTSSGSSVNYKSKVHARQFKRNDARAASLARREAMSTRGKAGISKNGMTAAQTARAANPGLSSRELAIALREQRSKNGKKGEKKSAPCGRQRPGSTKDKSTAADAHWKVGVSETTQGQTVTGTLVGRSKDVTGDEPSTCRAITGTEYLGADIFREFCQADPKKHARKVVVSSTLHGNQVTGNKIGRGKNVTGDEPGTCKNVTGDQYLGTKQLSDYCSTPLAQAQSGFSIAQTASGNKLTGDNVGRSEKVTGDEPGSGRQLTGTQYTKAEPSTAPHKVGLSTTLRGGHISGTMVGHTSKMTGDEPGSCRNVTGDDYIGQEQFGSYCKETPRPSDAKVGMSATALGMRVTGTMTGRFDKVTGDEPGTCKTVTGTPYTGMEQAQSYCAPEQVNQITARTSRRSMAANSLMTGIQPGVGGTMTGDSKGACETISGTPYVGANQMAEVCPANAAQTDSPDFPQSMSGTPWGDFSVVSPAKEVQQERSAGSLTGSRYEQGHITGPFGMASGKVSGTEEARYGNYDARATGSRAMMQPAEPQVISGRLKSRVTGEGQDAGQKITGDDWDRGDNVTGTEGHSATRRNPTMRSVMPSAMENMAAQQKRNEDIEPPVSKVTGGSGNTAQGSLITYSGGARG